MPSQSTSAAASNTETYATERILQTLAAMVPEAAPVPPLDLARRLAEAALPELAPLHRTWRGLEAARPDESGQAALTEAVLRQITTLPGLERLRLVRLPRRLLLVDLSLRRLLRLPWKATAGRAAGPDWLGAIGRLEAERQRLATVAVKYRRLEGRRLALVKASRTFAGLSDEGDLFQALVDQIQDMLPASARVAFADGETAGTETSLCIPVTVLDHCFGQIRIDGLESPPSVVLGTAADLMAHMAASAAYLLRLRTWGRDFAGRLLELQELSNRSRSQGEPPSEVLRVVAEAMRNTAGADLAFLYRCDSDAAAGVFDVALSAPGVSKPALQGIDPLQTPVELAMQTGGTVVVDGTAPDLQPEYARFFRSLAATGCMVTPIMAEENRLVATVMLLFRNGNTITRDDRLICETYARHVGLGLQNAGLYQQLEEQGARRQELLGEVVLAQEAERQRVSRDLHDWLAQGLVGPSYRVQTARRLLGHSPGDADAELAFSLLELKLAGEELRKIMKNLRPYLLDELGVTEAVRAYAAQACQPAGLDCTMEFGNCQGLERQAPSGIVLFRILQEALNNVIKHAGASRVTIRLAVTGGMVVLEVQDDGVGFTPLRRSPHGHGLGILGMRERAQLAGGRLHVVSAPGAGTLIRVQIPVQEVQNGH
jgi:signal transduction histidine kinase